MITISGELCDFNKYNNACRYNRFAGAKIKKEETERVAWECKRQKIEPITSSVFIEFYWYSKNERKDLDNICFAKKFILDGLVMGGIIKNDSRKFVIGFIDLFFIDKQNPRVEIKLNSDTY
jgi:Holliday junction resolvase RusA-like endonuclease